MKISVELPKQLFYKHDEYNDYAFILLHKLIEDEVYEDFMMNYNGFKILDNSCYELGESMSNEKLAEWVVKVNPDVFILPDKLGDTEVTIRRSEEFLEQYPYMANKAMPVVQGTTREEFFECYQYFRDKLKPEYIGIPFCFPWIEPWDDGDAQAQERVNLLHELHLNGTVNKNIKHHLLGTWRIFEYAFYEDFDWIYSIDTSNPIAAAFEGNKYKAEGLTYKPKIKFDEFFNMDVTRDILETFNYNMKRLRSMTNYGR
tara:strand:+ start:44 stop:817 length:774 start_codon:yes stop_codon:yes gene_type:complete